MKTDIKDQWLEALESDEYEQGQKQLRTNDDKYCCLGVLCDLAVKQGVAQWGKREGNSNWVIAPIDQNVDDASDTGAGLLPRFIQEWSGINTDDGTVMLDDSFKVQYAVSLTELNDVRDYNFSRIAEVIRERM